MRSVALVLALLLTASPITGGAVEWVPTWMVVVASAYDPCEKCCGRFADGLTYKETNAWKAGVAVDPAVIPLGSRLDIPGYKRGSNKNGSWILADDIGGGIRGKHIDVRFKTHSEALQWGRKEIKVRVWRRTR